MQCGVSTACFYPQQTDASLSLLQTAGVQKVEIFLNTFSELEDCFIDKLERMLTANNTEVLALHPFTSGMETFFFASAYNGGMEDGLRIYRRYFEVCRRLHIPYLIFHGDYVATPFPFEQHCANVLQLANIAQEYGVILCQENVVRCKCGFPQYITQMRKQTGDKLQFVLDLKQLRRAEIPVQEVLAAMRGKIAHLHLSDYDKTHDCLAPGKGLFDFSGLFQSLQQDGFRGSMVVELYRHNFADMSQLCSAVAHLDKIYSEVNTVKE